MAQTQKIWFANFKKLGKISKTWFKPGKNLKNLGKPEEKLEKPEVKHVKLDKTWKTWKFFQQTNFRKLKRTYDTPCRVMRYLITMLVGGRV